jgi:hypothetical protein
MRPSESATPLPSYSVTAAIMDHHTLRHKVCLTSHAHAINLMVPLASSHVGGSTALHAQPTALQLVAAPSAIMRSHTILLLLLLLIGTPRNVGCSPYPHAMHANKNFAKRQRHRPATPIACALALPGCTQPAQVGSLLGASLGPDFVRCPVQSLHACHHAIFRTHDALVSHLRNHTAL